MIGRPIGYRASTLSRICALILIALAYGWMSYRQHQFNPNDTTIPNLSQLAQGFGKILTIDPMSNETWLYEDMKATIGRHLGGLAIGFLLAFLVGVGMGVNSYVEAFFEWPLDFFAKIPPTAMMAVYFVLFGTQYKMFVAMISLGIFPILSQAIYQAVKKDISEDEIYKAYTLGASHLEVIWNVIVQSILPRIIESLRLQVGPALVFLIAAEMLVSDVGFGYRLRMQSRLLNMNVVYIYLAILAVSFFFIDWSLRFVRRRLCPWFGE